MLHRIINNLSRIKKYFTNPRSYVHENVQKDIFSQNPNMHTQNPSLLLLLENFQRNGHLKVTNKKHTLPIDNFKQINIDFQNLPQFLSNAKSNEEILEILIKSYCDGIGGEFFHLDDAAERLWFDNQLINRSNLYEINTTQRKEYARLMILSEEFDRFLGIKFQSVKRYSGEGAESVLVCLGELLNSACSNGLGTVVLSMAHRARNNILTVLLSYPPVLFFRKMLGKSEFPSDISSGATGDTFSHFFTSTEWSHGDRNVHVSMIPNPSHLEANIPVGAGKARSKMMWYGEGDYSSQDSDSRNGDNVLAIFIHGDASVCGQGIVPETLVMCNSRNFSIGGSIHIVINNKVGFTTDTPPGIRNVTDVAKITNCPILHVDGYNVLEVARAAMLALEYRQKFRKDIFINLLCFRRWGHNELDDPTITQPLMYAHINQCKSIPETFRESLIAEEEQEELRGHLEKWREALKADLSRAADYEPPMSTFKAQWAEMALLERGGDSLAVYDTGFDIERLREIGALSVFYPEDFSVHLNVLKSHIKRRMEKLANSNTQEANIDWATAEALSIGSLLTEGYNCRISGQDVGRGTFNHRHFSLVDQRTNEHIIPFNRAKWVPWAEKRRGRLEVANSILSEEAVLAFELGMALDSPRQLCLWEAQFGDFYNGAQAIVDCYLGSGEAKWLLQCGLVLLLPHGYDGAGPEHSSCRLERFLQLSDSREAACDSDSVSVHVAQPSTAAQYFHLLRRQLCRPFRRPLVVAAPKALLRSPWAASSLSELSTGTHFRHVLPSSVSPASVSPSVSCVLLCSGKHYYSLREHLHSAVPEQRRLKYAIVRLEQLAPFPVVELREELLRYSACSRFVWCQEEPRNMGAWSFVEARVRNLLGLQLLYAGRGELATPAVGIGELHKREVAQLLETAFRE